MSNAELEAERGEGDLDPQVFKVKKPKPKKKPRKKPKKIKATSQCSCISKEASSA